MHKRVIVEQAQGVSEVDFERMGTFPQAGIELTTRDMLAAGLYYAGLNTVSTSTVNVQIAPGRVYDGGRQYISETVQERTISD